MATNIFSRAKEIRVKHPRMTVQASVQKAGKELRAEKKSAVGGVKRKVKTVGKVEVKARTGTVKKKIGKTVGRVTSVGNTGALGAIKRGEVIYGTINKLEKKYANEKRKELKEILRLAINAEHDKLDNLKRQYKKVS